MPAREWGDPDRVASYLARCGGSPHRSEGDAALLEHLLQSPRRVLDLGTGDGRLLGSILEDREPGAGVAIDVSQPMLEAARARFGGSTAVEVVEHDLADPLPALGSFDVSSLGSPSTTSSMNGSAPCSLR